MFTSPFIYAAGWERKDKSALERKRCAHLKGRFPKSELTGRIIAGPVILTMKNAFFQEFLLKNHLLRACYLGFD